MLLDTSKPVEQWFDLPNYGEIREKYMEWRLVGDRPEHLLTALYELGTRANEYLLVPSEFAILPAAINIKGDIRKTDTAHKFKRFGWYVEIPHEAKDPQEEIIRALSWKDYDSNVVGYGWTTGRVRKRVPFLSLVEGLEYLALNTGPIAEQIHSRTGITFNPNRPQIYQDALHWRLPSRSKETAQAHLTKLTNLPFQNTANSWSDTDMEHTCEDAVYQFKSGTMGSRYFCDHAVAAYRMAQLIAPSDNPITISPFPVVKEGLVGLDDLMRYRVIREYPDGTKGILNEAERNKIFGWIVAYYRRPDSIRELFRRTGFEGIDWSKVVTSA